MPSAVTRSKGSWCVRSPGRSARIRPRPSSRTRRTAWPGRAGSRPAGRAGRPSPPSLPRCRACPGPGRWPRARLAHVGEFLLVLRVVIELDRRLVLGAAQIVDQGPRLAVGLVLGVPGEDDHQPAVTLRQQPQGLGVHPALPLERDQPAVQPFELFGPVPGHGRGGVGGAGDVRVAQHDQRLGGGLRDQTELGVQHRIEPDLAAGPFPQDPLERPGVDMCRRGAADDRVRQGHAGHAGLLSLVMRASSAWSCGPPQPGHAGLLSPVMQASSAWSCRPPQRRSCSILSLNKVVAIAALRGWPFRNAWANFLAWS